MDKKKLLHYDIVEQIGVGGMGEVYRARDTRLDRDVALKILPEAFAADAERLQRFEREAKLLAAHSHSHIASIFGFEQDQGVHFLVLELVDGEDLSKRLAKGALSSDEAVAVARQIADALDAAHEQGIIHRDLKPANIIVGPEGDVKVLDFGLAKALDSDDADPDLSRSPTIMTNSPTLNSPTMAGVILGTAAYMSPEQARGKRVDKRADIFAFGAVLYEMLTAQQAFSGETVSDTLAAVLKTEPDYNELPKDVSPSVIRLLKRCLDKSIKTRLRDIGEARITLDAIVSGDDETTAAIAGPPQKMKSNPWVYVAMAALVVVAATAWFMRPTAAPDRVRKVEMTLAGDESPWKVSISPDGLYMAYHAGDILYLRRLDELASREIARTTNPFVPFWSPDSKWIGWAQGDDLFKVSVAGGEPVLICETNDNFGGASGAGWMDNGRIAFAHGFGAIFDVSANGGDATVLVPLTEDDSDFHHAVALPGNTGLIYVRHPKEGRPNELTLWDGTAAHSLLKLTGQLIWDPHYAPSGHILFHRSPDNPGLWALPFSTDEGRVTGEAFLVAGDGSVGTTSNDGTLMYLRGADDMGFELVWVDREGETINIASDGLSNMRSALGVSYISLAPDGKRAALSVSEEGNRNIYVMDLERFTRTRITFETGSHRMPEWTPDGTAIAYREYETNILYMQPVDGSADRREVARGQFPSFSPDGRYLVSSVQSSEEEPLQYTDLETGETTTLLTGAKNWRPQVVRNGDYVAYESNVSGDSEIYLTRFPSGSGKWQVSDDGGIWPRWHPAGDRLYYLQEVHMMEVEVSFEPLRFSRPKQLFNLASKGYQYWGNRAMDISADDKFLLVKRLEGEDGRGVVMVENWLKAFTSE